VKEIDFMELYEFVTDTIIFYFKCNRVSSCARLQEDLGLDSLDIFDLTFRCEKEFNCSVNDEKVSELLKSEKTVRDFLFMFLKDKEISEIMKKVDE